MSFSSGQLEVLAQRVAGPEEAASERAEAEGDDMPALGENTFGESGPPRRSHGLPDRGMVTLEPQADEEHGFGSAAGLVAEWRELRTGGAQRSSRVDQARAEERRWEIEVLLMEEHHLTLPPDREPLEGVRREDDLQRRREALAHARRQRVTAERWDRLRTVLTLGLWRG